MSPQNLLTLHNRSLNRSEMFRNSPFLLTLLFLSHVDAVDAVDAGDAVSHVDAGKEEVLADDLEVILQRPSSTIPCLR